MNEHAHACRTTSSATAATRIARRPWDCDLGAARRPRYDGCGRAAAPRGGSLTARRAVAIGSPRRVAARAAALGRATHAEARSLRVGRHAHVPQRSAAPRVARADAEARPRVHIARHVRSAMRRLAPAIRRRHADHMHAMSGFAIVQNPHRCAPVPRWDGASFRGRSDVRIPLFFLWRIGRFYDW